MPPPIASLPTTLLRTCLSYFTGPCDTFDLARVHQRQAVLETLQNLAFVSREWYAVARAVASTQMLRTLRLEAVRDPHALRTRSLLLDLRRRATLRRAFLQELDAPRCLDRSCRLLFTADEWRSILAHAPQLKTIYLKSLPRESVLVGCGAIMEAAASHAPHLKALHLPWEDDESIEPPRDTARLLDIVLPGLAQWARNDGLRKLTLPLPLRRLQDPHRQAARYLHAVMKYCPNIELLDGSADMTLGLDELVCYEQWFVDEATWETFCGTCTQLTAFDWVAAPFATSFFEIFGRVCKPRLERLTFRTPMDWDWGLYHRHLPVLARGFGETAVNVHSALRACPALKELDVQLYLPGDEDDFSSRDEPANPAHFMLNKEIFGDDFCAAVVIHCRQLERFSMRRVVRGSDLNGTIQSFTNASLRSLATLPRLTDVLLTSVHITGDGLYALVTGFTHGGGSRKRNYKIKVGDETECSTTNSMAFYKVVEEFLTLLAEHDTLPFASQRVALRLLNGGDENVDQSWGERYLTRVRLLVQAVKHKHPSTRLRLVVQGVVSSSNCVDRVYRADRVLELRFYSHDGAEVENATVIDDVFIKPSAREEDIDYFDEDTSF